MVSGEIYKDRIIITFLFITFYIDRSLLPVLNELKLRRIYQQVTFEHLSGIGSHELKKKKKFTSDQKNFPSALIFYGVMSQHKCSGSTWHKSTASHLSWCQVCRSRLTPLHRCHAVAWACGSYPGLRVPSMFIRVGSLQALVTVGLRTRF